VNIWTPTRVGGHSNTGTSFASAIVAGMIAAQMGEQPSHWRLEALRDQTVDLGSTGKDEIFGWAMARFNGTCGR
jgi:hypothetical protein